MNHKHHFDVYPENVAIIGGGRWARVFIDELCGIVPSSVKLSVHSPRNAKGMAKWVVDRRLEKRIGVSDCLPSLSSETSNAVIVVNAAGDHEKTVEWALVKGYQVLVEKPLCLNFIAAQRLAKLALDNKIYLATAHVFLFASYVHSFSKMVSNENRTESVRVFWMDPKSESRYGEEKNYDSGLPVYADWLPHILSILSTFEINPVQLCDNLTFLKGGAHLKINLGNGQTTHAIELVRNGESRQRIIEVTTRKKTITLDFSSEPGTIYTDTTAICADPDWNYNIRPVAEMLKSFLQGAAGGKRDASLDNSMGVGVCRVIDQTANLYRTALSSWLNSELLKDQDGISQDLRYALTEILRMKTPNSTVPVEQRVDHIYQHLKKQVLLFNVHAERGDENIIELIMKHNETQ